MGGTLRSLRKAQQAREADIKQSQQRQQKRVALQQNREQIIAEICKTFGWSELDDFAKNMVNTAVAGGLVDIKKLKQDLAKWKEQKSDSSQEK